MRPKVALVAFVAALAAAAAFAPVGGATNECRGIQACIRVPGPWVVVPPQGRPLYLLSCPGGRSVVGGLDAQVTSRDVRVSFDGADRRTGAAGRHDDALRALQRGLARPRGCRRSSRCSAASRCRAAAAARRLRAYVSPPGQPLEYRSHVTILSPGSVGFSARLLPGRGEARRLVERARLPDEAAAGRSRTRRA